MSAKRVSLRLFLALCVFGGAAIGLWLRYQWNRPVDVIVGHVVVGDYLVKTSVRKYALGREELVYAIVITKGNHSMAEGPSPLDETFIKASARGITLSPTEVYIGGEEVDLQAGNCFVYVDSPLELIPIVTTHGQLRLEASQLRNLGSTPVWQTAIQPVAERAWALNDPRRRRELARKSATTAAPSIAP